MSEGRVTGIFIGPTEGVLPQPVDSVRALAGKGLEGNRYFYDDGAPPGRALTLISEDAVQEFVDETGIPLTPQESRRSVSTTGIDLNALVGKRFRVGDVECEGVELCEPCTTLQGMTYPEVLKGMVHRAGLNADILSDGEIAVGDVVAEA
jgi:MOSC domain-containing protein YiiM